MTLSACVIHAVGLHSKLLPSGLKPERQLLQHRRLVCTGPCHDFDPRHDGLNPGLCELQLDLCQPLLCEHNIQLAAHTNLRAALIGEHC